MGFLMPKMPSLPPVQPLPPAPTNTLTQAEQDKIAADQAAVQRAKVGRAATILTNADTLNLDQSNDQKKTLLGS